MKVRDVARAEQFYTEVLGFEVVMRLDRPRGVFFTLGEQHHDIAVLEMPADAEPVKDNQVGLHHIALQVDSLAELQECYRTLKAHNVRITSTIDHFITKRASIFWIQRGTALSCIMMLEQMDWSASALACINIGPQGLQVRRLRSCRFG